MIEQTPVEILEGHQYEGTDAYCKCGTGGPLREDGDMADHQLEALHGEGFAVTRLPEPLPGRIPGEFPRWEFADEVVLADTAFGEVLFAGLTLSGADAQALAARLLAASAAVERRKILNRKKTP